MVQILSQLPHSIDLNKNFERDKKITIAIGVSLVAGGIIYYCVFLKGINILKDHLLPATCVLSGAILNFIAFMKKKESFPEPIHLSSKMQALLEQFEKEFPLSKSDNDLQEDRQAKVLKGFTAGVVIDQTYAESCCLNGYLEQVFCTARALKRSGDDSSRFIRYLADELFNWTHNKNKDEGLLKAPVLKPSISRESVGRNAVLCATSKNGYLKDPIGCASQCSIEMYDNFISEATLRAAILPLFLFYDFKKMIALTIAACRVVNSDNESLASCLATNLTLGLLLRGETHLSKISTSVSQLVSEFFGPEWFLENFAQNLGKFAGENCSKKSCYGWLNQALESLEKYLLKAPCIKDFNICAQEAYREGVGVANLAGAIMTAFLCAKGRTEILPNFQIINYDIARLLQLTSLMPLK